MPAFHRRATTLAVLPLLLCRLLAAQEAAAGMMRKAISWTLSLDPFALTILFLFVATALGVLLQGRSRDRCLKRYHAYPVEAVLDTGKVSGRLVLGNACFELLPETPEETPLGRRTGYILYKTEYGRLRYILRDPERLVPPARRRRDRDIQHLVRPGMLRTCARWLSNLAGSFKDAFNDFLNLLLGRLRGGADVAQLTKGREKYTGQMRQELAALVPNTNYDAVLEGLRGKPVELEVKADGLPPVVKGTLAEYTAGYLLLVDTVVPGPPCPPADISVAEKGDVCVLRNASGAPLFISGAGWRLLRPGEEIEIRQGTVAAPLKAVVRDLLLPRSLAVVRFRLQEPAAAA